MNLQDMLNEALAEIEAMTADEFERNCLEFGYQPKRKLSFTLMPSICPVMDNRIVSYKEESVTVTGQTQYGFGCNTFSQHNYKLAA